MKCPVCGIDMSEGGLIVNCVDPGWVPMEQFRRKGIKRLIYTGLRTIGETNILLNQTKIPNAWFCRNCSKVMGVFEVTNHLEE